MSLNLVSFLISNTLTIWAIGDWEPTEFDAIIDHYGLAEDTINDWDYALRPSVDGHYKDSWVIRL